MSPDDIERGRKMLCIQWVNWFRDVAARLGLRFIHEKTRVDPALLERWLAGEATPDRAHRLGVFLLCEEAHKTDGRKIATVPGLPLPDDVDLTVPLKQLVAAYGGSMSRYVKLRKERGIIVPYGRPTSKRL